jgi:hypothetical protein
LRNENWEFDGDGLGFFVTKEIFWRLEAKAAIARAANGRLPVAHAASDHVRLIWDADLHGATLAALVSRHP